ncbi:DUF2512 family protein [Desmospora activa]|uniref:Uncharacterized protein DUF2512 n=1 Tax=Desmospora activa DSM 45169 TaxID=1121389 RepID=A0A2T4Z3P9_9BACL|nr:DUF2512 family protein [Desmospora activa]PTM56523.1 uncharacterized protein DUF2512 [Desmospora activa DSM 45169]
MNWLLKIIMYTVLIHSLQWLLPEFHYSHWTATVVVALFLATVGHFADQWVLPRLGNPISSIMGGLFIIGTVWAAQFLYPGSTVPLSVAAVIGIVLGVVEARMHQEILRNRKERLP